MVDSNYALRIRDNLRKLNGNGLPVRQFIDLIARLEGADGAITLYIDGNFGIMPEDHDLLDCARQTAAAGLIQNYIFRPYSNRDIARKTGGVREADRTNRNLICVNHPFTKFIFPMNWAT